MRRIALVLLLAFSFTIPWEYSLDLGAPFGNISRIVGILLLLAVIPTILQAGLMRRPGPMQWMALTFFLWFCCTFFWSTDTAATLDRMRGYAQVMTAVWVAWELIDTPEDFRNLMLAYVAGCWILAALTIADFVSPATSGQFRFVAAGQDPNDVARFLDLGFPLAVLVWDVDRRGWGRMLALGYLPLGLAGVLLTASRSGFLAALMALAGCGFLLVRHHRRLLLGAIPAFLALAALFWLSVPHATIARIGTIPEQLSSGDLNQRLDIWASGWQAFRHAPYVGSGAGSFVAASRLASMDTAHNSALAIAVEGGLIALAIGLGIVAYAARVALGIRGSTRIALLTALLVWMVASMVATVEANRATWFLLALIAVAGRLAADAIIEKPLHLACVESST